MKKLLRSDAVQAFLGWTLGAYIRLILATVRWKHENVACVEPVLASEAGAVALFWHGRIPLCLAGWPRRQMRGTARTLKAMISPPPDGQFSATALENGGFSGPSAAPPAKPGDSAKARQAVATAARGG